MVMQLLRSLLIDFALDTRNKEMFMQLVSPDWHRYVVQGEKGNAVPPEPHKYLVLWDKKRGKLGIFNFQSVVEDVVIAVREDGWDDLGWRDAYGLTLYDRLRSAGHKLHAMWMPTTPEEFHHLLKSYRVVHPQQLTIEHPGRKIVVAERDGSSHGQY